MLNLHNLRIESRSHFRIIHPGLNAPEATAYFQLSALPHHTTHAAEPWSGWVGEKVGELLSEFGLWHCCDEIPMDGAKSSVAGYISPLSLAFLLSSASLLHAICYPVGRLIGRVPRLVALTLDILVNPGLKWMRFHIHY